MRSNKNVIGRMAIVRDCKNTANTIVEAMVIDSVAGENTAKRVRLQTGEHFGEVRLPGEYKFMEFCEHGEAPAILASVWPT